MFHERDSYMRGSDWKNMREHKSPWLEGLNSGRVVNPLEGQKHADVVVIGGGIAGVSTAFELLEHSDMTVMLIEADRIVHGASGNGSGQVTPSFEGGFSSLAARFGPDLANAAFRQIASSKRRFGEVARFSGFRDQVHHVKAYIGFSSIDTAEALGRSSLGSVSAKQPLISIYAAAGSGWNCELRDRGISPSGLRPRRSWKCWEPRMTIIAPPLLPGPASPMSPPSARVWCKGC
jgi:hypothetical protein